MRSFVLVLLLGAAQARAAGIDRDSLLSEAPAVPDKGTVRVSGGATGTTSMSDRSLTSTWRIVSTWGQTGVMMKAPLSGVSTGPPALSE